MKGGYYNIDCTGLDLIKGSTKQTITGIRERVAKAHTMGKPVFCVNANWNGSPMSPVAVMVTKVGDDYICTASTLQIVVEKNGDKVHIVNMLAQ